MRTSMGQRRCGLRCQRRVVMRASMGERRIGRWIMIRGRVCESAIRRSVRLVLLRRCARVIACWWLIRRSIRLLLLSCSIGRFEGVAGSVVGRVGRICCGGERIRTRWLRHPWRHTRNVMLRVRIIVRLVRRVRIIWLIHCVGKNPKSACSENWIHVKDCMMISIVRSHKLRR